MRHLDDGGELIFIVPREFIKLTGARHLNDWLYAKGTITHWIEMGDARVFAGAGPNCAIFRFVRGDFSRRTLFRRLNDVVWDEREMIHLEGQLVFSSIHLEVPLKDLFLVKVGAVSGADRIFSHPEGNREFVFSRTVTTGQTRRMIYNVCHPHLEPFKEQLLARRVRPFDECNWWQWGRVYHDVPGPRIYVNGKTRHPRPFFTHSCCAYDGSILALFPRTDMDIARAVELLNAAVPWADLGFVVDGRYLFTQRSLATLKLPEVFAKLCAGGIGA